MLSSFANLKQTSLMKRRVTIIIIQEDSCVYICFLKVVIFCFGNWFQHNVQRSSWTKIESQSIIKYAETVEVGFCFNMLNFQEEHATNLERLTSSLSSAIWFLQCWQTKNLLTSIAKILPLTATLTTRQQSSLPFDIDTSSQTSTLNCYLELHLSIFFLKMPTLSLENRYDFSSQILAIVSSQTVTDVAPVESTITLFHTY